MSIEDQINDAVVKATKGLEAQINTLTKTLDEERSAKERFASEAEKARKNATAILNEKRELEGRPQKNPNKVSVDGVVVTDNAMQVPEGMVRHNPAAYRMWKARAAEQGLEFQILKASVDTAQPQQIPDRFTDADARTHYVSRTYLAGNGQLYREERDFAQSNKFKMVVVDDPSQLPASAFEGAGR